MAFDADKARVANQLIQNGLDPEQALAQAGVSPDDFDSYSINEVGTPSTNPSYGQIQSSAFAGIQRPNETVVPRGQDPEIDDQDEDIFQNARVTSQSTTTTQTTQITGGGSTTRRVVPTQYTDNAASRSLQAEANDLGAQAQARRDAIRAAGGTGRDVLADDEFRRLSNAQTAKEYEAERARTPVPNTGGIVTTVTPGVNQTTTTQTVDGNFAINRSSGFDPQAQTVDANQPSAVPARNFTAVNVTDPFEVDGAGIGLTDEEIFAQDNPTTPEDTQDTFAGNGYGFVYDEDGGLVPGDSAEADRIRNTPADTDDSFAGNGYGFVYNDDGELVPDDGELRPDNFDPEAVSPDSDPAADTGRFATATADDIAGTDIRFEPRPPLSELSYEDNGDGTGYTIYDGDGRVVTVVDTEQEAILYIENAAFESAGFDDIEEDTEGGAVGGILPTTQQSEAQIQAAKQKAQAQQAMARQRAQASQGDWRVKLRLAGAADYLYKAANPGILAPLAVTDGVIFPYTPSITTGYRANYSSYDLTHSNYRGYFYTGSTVEPVQIQATFTAQDTAEADYVLAVMQFFRSVTKMFYGQDPNRGVPPPLVFLQGLGQFQYNLHPCVVSSFNYTTPTDVDYIRAGVTTISGVGFLRARSRQTTTTSSLFGATERLLSLGQNVKPGAQTQPPAPPTIGTQDPTYVPTKLDIQLELLPMQTRQQVSEQFSLDKFANGDLVKGGFW